MFRWTPRVQFTQRRQNIRRQCKKIPLKVKKNYKIKVLPKKSFPSECFSGHVPCSCDNCGKFCAERKKIEKTCPFNVNNSFEMSRWTHRMQFWQSWRKNFPKVKNFLSSSAKKLRSNPSSLSTKLLYQNCFAGHLESGFDKPAEKFSLKERKNFVKIKVLSLKKNFSKIVSPDT